MHSAYKGTNSHHAPHSIESIQQRIQQHAERLNRWESQFQQWQDTWNEREVRLDRELAAPRSGGDFHKSDGHEAVDGRTSRGSGLIADAEPCQQPTTRDISQVLMSLGRDVVGSI